MVNIGFMSNQISFIQKSFGTHITLIRSILLVHNTNVSLQITLDLECFGTLSTLIQIVRVMYLFKMFLQACWIGKSHVTCVTFMPFFTFTMHPIHVIFELRLSAQNFGTQVTHIFRFLLMHFLFVKFDPGHGMWNIPTFITCRHQFVMFLDQVEFQW